MSLTDGKSWRARLEYNCDFARQTAFVRVTRTEFLRGDRWIWMTFVLRLYDTLANAWEGYKLVHSRNATRLSESDFQFEWQATRGAWKDASVIISPTERASRDGRVLCRKWSVAAIKQRRRRNTNATNKKTLRTYLGRVEDRLSEREDQLNTMAFGSNQAQDNYRSIVMRDGRSIREGDDGVLEVSNTRACTPIYYGVRTPAPPPSRKRVPVPVQPTPPFEWIVQPDPTKPEYTTTSINPGLQVSVQCALLSPPHSPSTRAIHFAGSWTTL